MITSAKRLFFLSVFIISAVSLHAGFKWTREKGWHLEDGAVKTMLEQSGALNVDGPKSGIQLLEQAMEAERKGDYSRALTLYKRVYTKYASSQLAPEALYRTGNIRAHYHQFSDANKAYMQVMTEYTEYESYSAVVEAEFDIASRLKAGERPYYWGIIPGFKDYSSSEKFFENVVKQAPYSPLAPYALYNLAELANKDHETDKAIDALERLIYGYSEDNLTPDAYILLANTHKKEVLGSAYDQGQTRDALGYYQDFITLFPTNERVDEAREGVKDTKETLAQAEFEMGQFYYGPRNNPKAALIFFNRAVALAPKSDAAEKARGQIDRIKSGELAPKGFIDYFMGRYEEEPEVDILARLEEADQEVVEPPPRKRNI